jgi:hypothetical protein
MGIFSAPTPFYWKIFTCTYVFVYFTCLYHVPPSICNYLRCSYIFSVFLAVSRGGLSALLNYVMSAWVFTEVNKRFVQFKSLKFRTKACCKYKAWHKRTLSRSTIDMGILIIRRMNPYGIFLHLLWIRRHQKHGDRRADLQREVDRKGHNESKASSPLSDSDLPMELSRS